MNKKEIIMRGMLFLIGAIMVGLAAWAHLSFWFDMPTIIFIFLVVFGTAFILLSVYPLEYLW